MADCFRAAKSKGGAELILIDDKVAVRVEKTLEGYDIGIKIDSELAQGYKRLVVKPSESTELTGTIDDGFGAPREVVRVFFSYGQLVVIGAGKVMIKDTNGGDNAASCQKLSNSAINRFINQIHNELVNVRTASVNVESMDRLANALGL